MGVDGTVNGRNNLDKSVSASPSSQLATVGSGTVGGGEGGGERQIVTETAFATYYRLHFTVD